MANYMVYRVLQTGDLEFYGKKSRWFSDWTRAKLYDYDGARSVRALIQSNWRKNPRDFAGVSKVDYCSTH